MDATQVAVVLKGVFAILYFRWCLNQSSSTLGLIRRFATQGRHGYLSTWAPIHFILRASPSLPLEDFHIPNLVSIMYIIYAIPFFCKPPLLQSRLCMRTHVTKVHYCFRIGLPDSSSGGWRCTSPADISTGTSTPRISCGLSSCGNSCVLCRCGSLPPPSTTCAESSIGLAGEPVSPTDLCASCACTASRYRRYCSASNSRRGPQSASYEDEKQ